MKTFLRWTIALLIGFPAAGCNEYDPWSVSPEPATVIGTWTGSLGTPGSGSELRVTWVVSPSWAGYDGPFTIVKPAPNVPATGILAATLERRVFMFGYFVPAGSVNGFPNCSISGMGQGRLSLSGSTITGTLQLTFTSCDGASSGLQGTTPLLTLTKREGARVEIRR